MNELIRVRKALTIRSWIVDGKGKMIYNKYIIKMVGKDGVIL